MLASEEAEVIGEVFDRASHATAIPREDRVLLAMFVPHQAHKLGDKFHGLTNQTLAMNEHV